MPSAPEVGDRGGDVGIIEVLEELKAEHIAQTASHIGVAGEVEVDLEGVRQNTHPGSEHAVFVGIAEHRGGQRAHLVGDEHLLAQAHAEQLDALGKAVERLAAVVELIGYVAVADDRSGDKLREQRHIGSETDKALGNRRVVAVYVDNIAHRLEGVEADTDRQTDMQVGNIQERQHIQRVGDHARVFEHREYSYIKYAGQNKKQLFLFGVLTVFIYKPASDVVE